MKLRILSERDYPGLAGGTGHIIIRILMCEKVTETLKETVRIIQHEKDLTVCCLLNVKMEGAMSQGTKAASKS